MWAPQTLFSGPETSVEAHQDGVFGPGGAHLGPKPTKGRRQKLKGPWIGGPHFLGFGFPTGVEKTPKRGAFLRVLFENPLWFSESPGLRALAYHQYRGCVGATLKGGARVGVHQGTLWGFGKAPLLVPRVAPKRWCFPKGRDIRGVVLDHWLRGPLTKLFAGGAKNGARRGNRRPRLGGKGPFPLGAHIGDTRLVDPGKFFLSAGGVRTPQFFGAPAL